MLRGDIVTNADISGAIKEHYRIKKAEKEKKLILTKIFSRMPFSDNTRAP